MRFFWICLIVLGLVGIYYYNLPEECRFFVHIYDRDGSRYQTLGPFGNEDEATDEAGDYIRYRGSDGDFYRAELRSSQGCRENE